MSIWEILLIGLGLSMDAAAVSLANGMVYAVARKKALTMAGLFGAFQALMPCLGYWIGGLFADLITQYSGILVAIILGVLGLRMLWSAWRESGQSQETDAAPGVLTYKMLLVQALATSIDAFAVGIGFRAADVQLWVAAIIIGCTTLACSLLALFVGKKFGGAMGRWAQVLGGCILVFLAIKALF